MDEFFDSALFDRSHPESVRRLIAALIEGALRRVTRRHQVRHQFRVPGEFAGTMDGAPVRIVDLTPDGAALVTAGALSIGDDLALQMEFPRLEGGTSTVRVDFTVRSCRSEDDQSWRVGGTLVPETSQDGHALIELCHLVHSLARPAESGRPEPGAPIDDKAVAATQPLGHVATV